MTDHTQPILVAGGGVGGLTAALALARHGFPVRVYERRSLAEISGSAGFGHTIWSNATTSLARLGLAERLREIGDPISAAENRDPKQRVIFRMDMGRAVQEGAMPALGIGRGDLMEMLRKACQEHGVEVRYDVAVTAYAHHGDGVTVTLGEGDTETGAGLVGADGVRSAVLQQLHGSLPLLDTGRSTYRGVADTLCGLRPGVVHLFSDPATGTAGGAWPIGGERVVWTLSYPRPAEGGDPEGPWQRARELADCLGEVPRTFVARTPPETASRTHVFYHSWIDAWGDGPVTLIGDAAHTMPTELGQGACQAIEDGVVLADALALADDVPAGMRAYEQRRRPRVHWIRQQVVRANSFRPVRNPVLRWAMGRIGRMVIAAKAPAMWQEIQQPPELHADTPAGDSRARRD